MSRTVALYSPAGNVGLATIPHLVRFHESGTIKLVLLHRDASDLSKVKVPADVERRPIDTETVTERTLEAVKDLDLLISVVSFQGWPSQSVLIQALAKVNKRATFIPANFGAQYSRVDTAAVPQLAPLVGLSESFGEEAQRLGVPLAIVIAGFFADGFFTHKLLETDITTNTVAANEAQLDNRFPFITQDYLGAGLAQIATQDLSRLTSGTHSLIERWVSGNEIVEAFTEINGTKPRIIDFTPEDEAKGYLAAPFGTVMTRYRHKWQENAFDYPNPIEVNGFPKRSLIDIIQQATPKRGI